MKQEMRQNISDVLTDEGKADIIKRFKENEHPPVLTFLQDGKKVEYKVVSVSKGIWVRKVRLYDPDELDVVDRAQ